MTDDEETAQAELQRQRRDAWGRIQSGFPDVGEHILLFRECFGKPKALRVVTHEGEVIIDMFKGNP
jgi:hypothetical protein